MSTHRGRCGTFLSPSALTDGSRMAPDCCNISNQVTPLAANSIQVDEYVQSKVKEKESKISSSSFSNRSNSFVKVLHGISEMQPYSPQDYPSWSEDDLVVPETAPETVPGTLRWPKEDLSKPSDPDTRNKENLLPGCNQGPSMTENINSDLVELGQKLTNSSSFPPSSSIEGSKRYVLRSPFAVKSGSKTPVELDEEAVRENGCASYSDRNQSETNEVTPCLMQNALKFGKRRRSKSKRDTEKNSSFGTLDDDDAFNFMISPDVSHVDGPAKSSENARGTKRSLLADIVKPMRTRSYKKARVQR